MAYLSTLGSLFRTTQRAARLTVPLAIVLVLLVASCGQKKEPEKPAATPTLANLVVQDRTLTEKGSNYTLDIHYPETGLAMLDTLISTFVHGGIDRFREGIGTDTLPHNWTNELVMTYSYVITLNRYVSMKFDTYLFTGGAHGMTFIKTLNYDQANHRVLGLPELFHGDYLDTLSSLTYELLKDSLGKDTNEEMLRSGTEPKPESFQRFQITPAGIQFHFEAYAVAPYAWGERQVTIPFPRLANILIGYNKTPKQ